MASRNIRWWKVLGVAGAVGVVATGALVARDERRRRSYTPDEVRDRLRERVRDAEAAQAEAAGAQSAEAQRPDAQA